MDCARNIITANFSGGGTSATTAPLWQWDYGQALYITGIEDHLPAAFEVHFSTNRTGGVSTVAVGADGQVTIPNVLLTIGKNLNAWIYLSDAQGEGETEYSILIPVKARPMPETYDAEVSGEFDDVVRQVSEYAETAQTAADNAGASASAAATSASEAAASASAAESAKTAAETAQGKAEDAQTAAETAAQTATQKAQQTAQDAAQAALDAGRAESAAQRAEAAQTGAESAKMDAETAAQGAAASAVTATEKANLAGQSATAAAESASAAAQSAASIEGDVQIASQKAAEAQTAAGQAVTAKDAAQTAQQGAETAATNAGQSASTATAKAAEAAQSASSAAQSKTDAEAAATRAETAAASLTVDSALSDTSVNPVQNKVITESVTQVKSAITDITGNTAIPVIGYHEYIDLSGSSVTMLNGVPQKTGNSGAYSYGMIACSAGDKFTINGTGGGQTRAYGFVASNGSILAVSPKSKTYTGLVITAPEDSAWLIVHTNDDRVSYVGTELKILVQENADKIVVIDSTEKKQYVLNWVLGVIDNTGAETSSSNRIHSNSVPFSLVDIIELDSGVKYALKFYDTNGVFVGGTGYISTSGTMAECLRNIYTVTGREAYVRFQMAYSSDDNISDVSALGEKLTFTRVSYPKDLQDQILEVEQKLTGPYIPELDWVLGHIGTSGSDTSAKNRIREREMLLYSIPAHITAENDIKYVIRTYNSSGVFIAGTGWKTGNGNIIKKYIEDAIPTGNEYYYRIAVAYSTDVNVTDIATLASKITIEQTMAIADLESVVHDNAENILTLQKKHRPPINSTGLGNCSIRCAKEQSYVDGSAPQIEFFLLEEPVTHNFYYSRDLSTKEYMFTFTGDAHKYSFGVLQNGDIIACLDADAISVNTKDDANRQNPYVFLASENWSIQHEVNFGSSLKPCGWLENCGFKVLANGDAIFCEYTRQTTATANAWKISGDPTNKANWTVTQSFAITTTDNSNGFKHCHMVMQDFYTGICYLATGDSDTGAMLFYSDDNGSTWTQLLSPDSASHDHETGFSGGSEKYCRMLSMTFTKDFIYWASDTAVTVNHFLFKAERDINGALDYSTVEEVVNIPMANYAATYGTAYIPELNAILLLERTDNAETEMPVRMVTLADGQLHTIGKMEVCPDLASTGANLGFRTRFSEWYPYNGLVRVGYDLHMQTHNNAVNQNKGFGNEGHTTTGNGSLNINNLFLQIYRNGTDYGFHLGTYYL